MHCSSLGFLLKNELQMRFPFPAKCPFTIRIEHSRKPKAEFPLISHCLLFINYWSLPVETLQERHTFAHRNTCRTCGRISTRDFNFQVFQVSLEAPFLAALFVCGLEWKRFRGASEFTANIRQPS